MGLDKPLLILAVLLALTMIAYFTDVFPYPFGSLVIVILLIARISYLQGRRK